MSENVSKINILVSTVSTTDWDLVTTHNLLVFILIKEMCRMITTRIFK